MNTEEKKTFQSRLKAITNMRIPVLEPQCQDLVGKGDRQLDKFITDLNQKEQDMVGAYKSLVSYAKSRLEK